MRLGPHRAALAVFSPRTGLRWITEQRGFGETTALLPPPLAHRLLEWWMQVQCKFPQLIRTDWPGAHAHHC